MPIFMKRIYRIRTLEEVGRTVIAVALDGRACSRRHTAGGCCRGGQCAAQDGLRTVLLTGDNELTATCPLCGFAKPETMPADACQFYYECSNCKALLRPNPGDCCVFCSFGSVKCPPIQQQLGCCS